MPFQPKSPFPPDDAHDEPPGDEAAWEVEADAPVEETELYDQGAPIVSDEEIAAAPTVIARLGEIPSGVRLLALIVVLALIVLLVARACSARRAPAPAPTATPSPTVAAGEVRATFTPTPSSGGVLTDTAPLPATPLATPIAPPAPGAFPIGQRVEVFGTEGQGIRFRTGPGLNYITTTILQDGVVLTVVGGPEEADGFTWWRLQMDTGAVGWAAGNNLRPAP